MHKSTNRLLAYSTSVFLSLAGLASAQAPDASKPPVTYANTLATIGLDARIQTGDFAPQSLFLQSIPPGSSAYVSFDVPQGKQASARRAVLALGKDKKHDTSASFQINGLKVVVDNAAGFSPGSTPTQSQIDRIAMAEASVKEYPIRCLLVPPEYVLDTYEQALPVLPKSLGALNTTVVTRGVRWAALGLDPSTKKLEAVIQSATPEDAELLSIALPGLLAGAKLFMSSDATTDIANILADNGQPHVKKNRIHLNFETLNDAKRTAIFANLATSLLGAEQQALTRNKLRRIQLAILNYESANQCLPPREQARGNDGKSGLSWRVHILPYFGPAEAKLYREFRLKEPWNSKHNQALLAKMPNCYRAADTWLDPTANFDTVFLAPKGDGTVFDRDAVMRIVDIKDGMSVTVSVVKVASQFAVPWTSPDDYDFAPADPAAKLDFSKTGMAMGVAFDGSVHDLDKTWEPSKFLRLFRYDDGQPVRW